jgi:hypothetical protein
MFLFLMPYGSYESEPPAAMHPLCVHYTYRLTKNRDSAAFGYLNENNKSTQAKIKSSLLIELHYQKSRAGTLSVYNIKCAQLCHSYHSFQSDLDITVFDPVTLETGCSHGAFKGQTSVSQVFHAKWKELGTPQVLTLVVINDARSSTIELKIAGGYIYIL